MSSGNEKLCFVIMPFQDDMKEVYWKAIKPACEQAGYRSLRVDELEGVYNINKKIIQNIFLSEAIIADLTHWRPNVFYEMGVAHAVSNKTIMIIQQDQKVPFDVSTYRCIQYRQTPEGLAALAASLGNALKFIEHWRLEPSNPVQDYMPGEAVIPLPKINALQNAFDKAQQQLKHAVPKADFEAVKRELQDKESRLRASVSKNEVQHLQQALQDKETQIANSVPKAQWITTQETNEKLAKENQTLRGEIAELRSQKTAFPGEGYPKQRVQFAAAVMLIIIIALSTQIFRSTDRQIAQQPENATAADLTMREPWLRSIPDTLSQGQVKNMLAAKSFYDRVWNKTAKDFKNAFRLKVISGDSLVMDLETGLTWERSGSSEYMNYANAEKYIRDLNAKQFAGYNDWRLPTLEEGMSLMESKKHGNLYIDPLFDQSPMWIWTADKKSAGVAWVVSFCYGGCGHSNVDITNGCVRAVRGGQSNI